MKALKRFGFGFLVIVGLAALLLSGCAPGGGEFPNKGVDVMVPWSPGGGSDRVCRALAGTWPLYADVPLRVVNMSGGGGVDGHVFGAAADPDGYTLTVTAINVLTMPAYRPDIGFALDDFTPLFNIVQNGYFIMVNKDAPWDTLDELLSDIEANPGKLSYGSAGAGSDSHLATEMLLQEAGGLKANHLPLEGGSEQLAMILGGQLDFNLGPYGTYMGAIDEIKVLAVSELERYAQTPDVPTCKELGIDYEFTSFRCMLLPAGTPEDRVATLEGIFKQIMDDDGFKAQLSRFGEYQYWEDSKTVTDKLYRQREAIEAVASLIQ
ncbi:Bug family tripartite tricarboxylate transporter substrate binding protein [Chloroflexota bacterium]